MEPTRARELRTEAVAGLAPGDRLRLTVDGASMAPVLRPGDQVVVERLGSTAPGRARLGDLVVVDLGADVLAGPGRGCGLVVHRLLWIGRSVARTRGDGSGRMDPPVDPRAVLARVVRIERGGAEIPVSSARRRLAWLTCFAAAAGRRVGRRWLATTG